MNLCCICTEQTVAGTQWLCSKCVKEHDLANVPFRDWPEWAKECMRWEQERRRTNAQERDLGVVTFSECSEADILAYGKVDE